MNIIRDPSQYFSDWTSKPDVSCHKLPGRFWIRKGEGYSDISQLNAFDHALLSSGIAGLNLVPYSSVIPFSSSLTNSPLTVEPGSQTGVIIAVSNGRRGDTISSGIAVAKGPDYHVVFEHHGILQREELEAHLVSQIKEAVKLRGGELDEIYLESVESTVSASFGCNLVVIVFDPVSYH